jgi:hypothetical protein
MAAFLLGLALWMADPPSGHSQIGREYQLKAVFLFNFAQFTDWPESAFADKDSPFVIGILGTDPFGMALEATVRGEKAHGRAIVIQRYQRLEEIKNCHILFISQSEGGHLDKVIAAMKDKPVFTVSEIEGSVFRGVILRFVTENNKIRFRVNLEAAEQAHLTISSKLLRVAEVIRGNTQP